MPPHHGSDLLGLNGICLQLVSILLAAENLLWQTGIIAPKPQANLKRKRLAPGLLAQYHRNLHLLRQLTKVAAMEWWMQSAQEEALRKLLSVLEKVQNWPILMWLSSCLPITDNHVPDKLKPWSSMVVAELEKQCWSRFWSPNWDTLKDGNLTPSATPNGGTDMMEKQSLFEDFKPGLITLYEFKRIVDSGGFQVEVKGGTAEFVAKLVLFTSNYNPRSWYPSLVFDSVPGGTGSRQSDDFHAFTRRLEPPIGRTYPVDSREDIMKTYRDLSLAVPDEPELLLDLDAMFDDYDALD